jgi:GNAT superfamily N-acetyltransferase
MSNEHQSIEGAYQGIAARYPLTVQSRDGKELQVRLMGSSDRELMLAFARALPPQDLLFLRRDITQPTVVDEWIRDIGAHRTFSVLAFDGDQLIGDASLHHNPLTWSRHRGEVRLVIGSEGRGHGVGRVLAEELNIIGRLLGLQILTAQVPFDQQTAMTVFRQLGYEREAVLADYVVASDGITRDLLVATYRL